MLSLKSETTNAHIMHIDFDLNMCVILKYWQFFIIFV